MNLIKGLRTLISAGQGIIVGMDEATAKSDPIELFSNWFNAAEKAGLFLPESVALATSSRDGKPSARMVLLKSFDSNGFVFYTNYGSRKSAELLENPHAALLFHWAVLQRQIRIEGIVEKVSEDESDEYFATRGRGSQIGAWASKQSEPLRARKELEDAVRETKKRFKGQEINRPQNWGGFRLRPERIEFWQGRANRLHDRIIFSKSSESWSSELFYP
jgi:pyridoxamine 5'-phosphate oxidase